MNTKIYKSFTRRFLGRIVASCVFLLCGLTYSVPTFALRPMQNKETLGGLEEGNDRNREWNAVHSWITGALRDHPGGRLKLREFAKGILVSVPTLYHHDFHALVVEENTRRLQSDLSVIKVQRKRIHTRDPVSSIKAVLRSHPGEPLSIEKLARLARVSRQTLYNHHYRSLVAVENRRRARGSLPAIRIPDYHEHKEYARDPASSIRRALENHPGGRLTMRGLARLAKVGVRALLNHDYHALVQEENKRRLNMAIPLPLIEAQRRPAHAPTASQWAGLEEAAQRYDGTLGVRAILQPDWANELSVDLSA